MVEKESKKGIFSKTIKVVLILIIIAVLCIGGIFGAINLLLTDHDNGAMNIVINFTNVTGKTKHEVLVENDIVYFSLDDIDIYYDCNIYYDENYNQIVTSSEDKVAIFKLGENAVEINGVKKNIKGPAKLENKTYYLPISEMEDVYNIKVKKVNNNITLESLDRKSIKGTITKKVNLKSKAKYLSKNIEKLSSGSVVRIAEVDGNSLPDGWLKIRTENGKLGYIQKKYVNNITVEREAQTKEKLIDGKISLVWDYFSEYAKAPDNTGKKYDGVNVVSPSFFYLGLRDMQKPGAVQIDIKEQARVKENVGDSGEAYIKWAKENGYKIWPKFSNETLESTIDEFSTIINDYELRKIMINDIVSYVEKYNLDGINLDFEYMYKNDKDSFSKFVIELAPRLRAINACLSVDVTAPDGGDNWSLCYDRKTIADAADYIVFMGYDQYGAYTVGTTSGYSWVENSIAKMLKDNIPSEKIILGLPFYTKLWKTKDGKRVDNPTTVGIKDINNAVLSGVNKEWLEDLQQNYIQYERGGYLYKLWIEDEQSFEKKLLIVNEHDLAGAAYWRKGFESASVWEIVKNVLELN